MFGHRIRREGRERLAAEERQGERDKDDPLAARNAEADARFEADLAADMAGTGDRAPADPSTPAGAPEKEGTQAARQERGGSGTA